MDKSTIKQMVSHLLAQAEKRVFAWVIHDFVKKMDGKPLVQENLAFLQEKGYQTLITYYVDWHGNPKNNQEERFWQLSCRTNDNIYERFFVVSRTLSNTSPQFDYQTFLLFHQHDLEQEKQDLQAIKRFMEQTDLDLFAEKVHYFWQAWEQFQKDTKDFPCHEELLYRICYSRPLA